MEFSEILRQDASEVYRVTETLFRQVDDLDWKPVTGENWMTTGQLLHHCAEACGKPMKGLVTGDWGLPEGAAVDDMAPDEKLPPADRLPTVGSIEEALELLAADHELCMDLLDGLDDDRLLGDRSPPPWGGPERTLFQHLNQMIWHLAQHKGQLFYYLKLQGKPVNTMDLWMAEAP